MEVGDSVPATFFMNDFVNLTLKKSLLKKVFPSLKLTIAKDKETLDERLHTIVQNAEEVSFITISQDLMYIRSRQETCQILNSSTIYSDLLLAIWNSRVFKQYLNYLQLG